MYAACNHTKIRYIERYAFVRWYGCDDCGSVFPVVETTLMRPEAAIAQIGMWGPEPVGPALQRFADQYAAWVVSASVHERVTHACVALANMLLSKADPQTRRVRLDDPDVLAAMQAVREAKADYRRTFDGPPDGNSTSGSGVDYRRPFSGMSPHAPARAPEEAGTSPESLWCTATSDDRQNVINVLMMSAAKHILHTMNPSACDDADRGEHARKAAAYEASARMLKNMPTAATPPTGPMDTVPTTPRGKVPLSVKDPTAQDLLWVYAQRRRSVDAQFSADLEIALRAAGFRVLTVTTPPAPAPSQQQPSFRIDFTCPKCGSHNFGSSPSDYAPGPDSRKEKFNRSCHGLGGNGCGFTWHSDDDGKYGLLEPPRVGMRVQNTDGETGEVTAVGRVTAGGPVVFDVRFDCDGKRTPSRFEMSTWALFRPEENGNG